MSKLGSKVELTIEVTDDPLSIVVIMDRPGDSIVVPWQDAFQLSQIGEQVINSCRSGLMPIYDQTRAMEDRRQVYIVHHKGMVGVRMAWTDRLIFKTVEGFFLFMRDLRKEAQDCQLECEKEVYLTYDGKGMIKKLYNRKLDETQIIPGRS